MLNKLIGTPTSDYIPTNDELRAFIEQIIAFLKSFLVLFDRLKDGLRETFAGYTSPFGTETDA